MYRINPIVILFVFNFTFIFSELIVQKAELANRPNETSIIDTNLGSIIGYKKVVLNKTISVFFGVPYALPPINELRFKRTKLIKTFPTQPLEALTFKPHCMQAKSKKYNINDRFDEDCLYMNIWTPNLDEFKKDNHCTKKFDTIAYFYGGKSSIYQMSPLLDDKNNSHLSYSADIFPALHDVIFITINFRQELFSSLQVEDEFPGNLVLFDQSLALQWIKQNIESFCGNGQITAAGNSLGGMAVGLHVMSKYSKNLIKNAIIQSGAPLFQDLVPISKDENAMNSFMAIKKLGCLDFSRKNIFKHLGLLENDVRSKFFNLKKSSFNEEYFFKELDKSFKRLTAKLKERRISSKKEELIDKILLKVVKYLAKRAINLECLKNLTPDQIVNVGTPYNSVEWQISYDFDFIDTESYLDYQLFNKLNLNPNLNMLIGGVSDEQCSIGVFLNGVYYADKLNPPQMPKEDAKKLIKNFYTLIMDNGKTQIASIMADYYTDETKWELSKGYYESFVNVGSDYQFDCPSHFYASYGSRTAGSVQTYRITQMPSKHFGSNIYDLDYAWAGPCHADELNSLFGLPFRVPEQFTDLDREFSQKLIRLWASFAKNGEMPRLSNGDKWPVANKRNSEIRYVEINNKYIRERDFEFEERCNMFWKPLLPFYKR